MVESNPEISLVLMDIKMPVMNGYLATKKIKKLRPDLPVIAQTAYALVGDREKAIQAGCDDYISKPILEEKLIEMLKKYL
jgi:CheY-like chemotaxis protein